VVLPISAGAVNGRPSSPHHREPVPKHRSCLIDKPLMSSMIRE